ncbi:uncharacterized protein SPPG_05787 [Spizellomyces punctatus DAOM BR117]|uniref:Cache domain-containing protein n=1 Tax=Spizellomyces punctatus (strain DAOM BR117) TaxID=645134 RepID=A0A0L0HCY8_SPIPD|nr:uncharacterized protein SPPG_05787 [Spizellomyces punctatus DAOM BR117]KNC98809.1 hypothetical protein SPPG_05787 [Spizellomyces punctatus DAOM BR117]|eukprot:XP_016606849.1 hypothetical protein SPPG_05787 [Spizellomyces punctatus DAOM BR117]
MSMSRSPGRPEQSVNGGSSTTDPTMSLNSKGEMVLSNRVWTFHRFITGLKSGRAPISLILIAFITSLATGIAFLAWGLTFRAATNSATILAQALQRRIIDQVVSDVAVRFLAVEASTAVSVLNFRQGYYSAATYADKDITTQKLLNVLVPNVNFYSTQYFTTVPEGELWGASTSTQGTVREYHLWRQYGGNLTTWDVAANGTNLGPVTSDLNQNNTNSYWVQAIDVSNANAFNWSSVQVWDYKGWKSFLRVFSDDHGTIQGVVGADLTLSFIQTLLAESKASIPYNNLLYAFEMAGGTDTIVASSEPDVQLYELDSNGAAVRALTLPEIAVTDKDTAALYQLLQTKSDGSLSHWLSIHPTNEAVELELSGGTFSMMVGRIQRANTDLAIIAFINRDAIMGELQAANRKTIAIVAGVVVAGCSVAVVFSFFLAKALHRITRDLRMLANFKFQDVLQQDIDKESGVRRPQYSRISELWQIQRAFHKMVITFARAVSQNKRFSERRPTLLNNQHREMMPSPSPEDGRDSIGPSSGYQVETEDPV